MGVRGPPGYSVQAPDAAGLQDWFRRMRAEEPVSRDDAYGTWHVFRYADIEPVLADPVTFSSDLTGLIPRQPEVELFSRGNFVRMDPPRHDKLRRLVSKASLGSRPASTRSPATCSARCAASAVSISWPRWRTPCPSS